MELFRCKGLSKNRCWGGRFFERGGGGYPFYFRWVGRAHSEPWAREGHRCLLFYLNEKLPKTSPCCLSCLLPHSAEVPRSLRRNSGPISYTLEMDVYAWPARLRTGIVECIDSILMDLSRSLNYRSWPSNSFRLVPCEALEY